MPEINSIAITRTVYYTPEAYLDWCQEIGKEPTQDDFIEYVQEWIEEDFVRGNGEEEVKILY